jgi:hypothetical protein
MHKSSDQIVRGNVTRALLTFACLAAVPLAVALGLLIKEHTARRVGIAVAITVLIAMFVVCMAAVAASSVARVRQGRLNFYFFGLRTRSFPLDANLEFELRKIGRLQIMVIHCGASRYVPNGALDRAELIDLLRSNGVAERTAR